MCIDRDANDDLNNYYIHPYGLVATQLPYQSM